MAKRKPTRRKTNKAKGTRRVDYNRRRRGIMAIIIPWVRRFGFVLAGVTLVVWVGAWLWLSGSVHKAAERTQQFALDRTAQAGLTVQNIMVEGRVNQDGRAILAIVDMQVGDPLLAFRPLNVQEQIENLAWVGSARVERRLPDTIYIDLTERVPMALWQKDKTLRLLDQHGEVIAIQNIHPFKDKIVITGDDAPAHMPDLMTVLIAEPLVFNQVRAASYIGDRRWDLRLKDGTLVRLPEVDIGFALRRLAQAEEKDQIFSRDISAIDMREPDRLVIRTRPGAVQEYKASLKPGDDV